ncbi:amino acid transporter AVT1I-like [Nicotiana tabacum]|uniref:Amino acid transporter AVT1I-like n=1 Tax=Nicotiana tabacum TaxID=4097 RepID=A0A1S4DBK0_TOBAC|nr:PREDICTED: vacuolar amino acid transporter 1-like [Nicotiana tabacum]
MEPKSEDDYSNIRVRLLVANDNYHKQNQGSSEETGLEDPQVQHEFVSAGPTSFSRTCFNGLNALSGVGILSVPYALASGGWLSLIFLFIIAISTYYTSLLIQRCMDIDPTITSYPDIGERAFGKGGRMLVSTTMNVELYMVVTGFLILEGDNLQNLFGDIEFQIFGVTIGGKQSFVVIISLIILPTVWLNNMSILSYISASGVVASIVLLGSILWAAVFDGLGFQANGTQFINWKGMPTAVSLYAFCYCAHPVFPTLYTSMINPKKFSKVMLVCFLLCTISYASMAIVGYLMFGPTVLSQITLNLPTNKISSKVAIYTTLVNPIAKYGLMIKPLVNSFENQLPINFNKRLLSILIRTALVISTIIVALAIPLFGYLMSLVGAFLSITASIILPCLCFVKISGIYQILGFELVVILGIVVMGIAIMIVGTYTSVVEIIGHLYL